MRNCLGKLPKWVDRQKNEKEKGEQQMRMASASFLEAEKEMRTRCLVLCILVMSEESCVSATIRRRQKAFAIARFHSISLACFFLFEFRTKSIMEGKGLGKKRLFELWHIFIELGREHIDRRSLNWNFELKVSLFPFTIDKRYSRVPIHLTN
jgi:hypothetical protein